MNKADRKNPAENTQKEARKEVGGPLCWIYHQRDRISRHAVELMNEIK
jgi:hypothetical protein